MPTSIKLFKTTQSRPFSFFSSVFILWDIFGTNSFDQILAHECVHVRQLHSVDRLLIDFFVALFWFNPFMYLYRRALIEVHEYEADAMVVKQYDDLVGYQEILYSQLQTAQYPGLVSHFNFSTIKKRIVMMNKSKTKKQTKLAYFFALPLLALIMMAFTSKEVENSAKSITTKLEKITVPVMTNEIPEKVNKLQEDQFKPSILPLKSTAKFKVSSGFGMRMHPVEKVRRHRGGIDLATQIGTVVVATADGIVEESNNSSKGYGNMLLIKHGDKYKTRYSQLSEFKVSNGEKVKKGQVIALTGTTGQSTGPHLHYEVIENGKRKNPMDYIKNYKFSMNVAPSVQPRSSSSAVVGSAANVDSQTLDHVDGVVVADVTDIEGELATVVRATETRAAKAVVGDAPLKVAQATEIATVQRVNAVVVLRHADVAAEAAVEEVEMAVEVREVEELKEKLAEAEMELAEYEKIREALEKSKEKEEKTKEKLKNKVMDKAKSKPKNKVKRKD